MINSLNADLYANEHANMDSLPFRYGFQYPRDRTIELYKASDWEQQKNDRYKVTASFQDVRGNEQRGTFILMKTPSPILKVVTVWRNDQKNEFYLSELMKNLRKDGKIRVSDLIDLHPRYLSGELVSMSALFDALVMKADVNLNERDPDIEEKIKTKYEEQITNLEFENSRVRNIAEVAVKGLKEQDSVINEQEAEIKKHRNDYDLLAAEFEEYKKENQKAANDRTASIATLSEITTLKSVNRNIMHRGSSCTELVFSNGDRKYMKTVTFDPTLSVTSKAERLVNRQVKTTCWDPVNQPGYWSSQGYFRGIYQVQTDKEM
jgi:hypothetical protein